MSKKPAFDVDKLIRGMFAAGPVEHDFGAAELLELFSRSRLALAQCPTVLDINAPLVICGDIHGQYADLLNIFEKCGWPFNTRYLFLGDYVDRGSHSLEVLVLLSALQLRFPENVHLLRGNHEIPSVNVNYGFLSELRARFQEKAECEQIWDKICALYGELPIAALVCQSMLCLHGGLSPTLKSLGELRDLKRGQQEPAGLLEELLWADPSASCKGFAPNDDRGCAFYYGDEAIDQQFQKLGVSLLVRGHQVVDNGIQFSNKNRVLTLFSAPSYSDDYHNRAAVLQVSRLREVTVTYVTASRMRKVGKTAAVLRSSY